MRTVIVESMTINFFVSESCIRPAPIGNTAYALEMFTERLMNEAPWKNKRPYRIIHPGANAVQPC